MDASYVNPFVQGAQRVFTTLCNETPTVGKIFVKTKPYSVLDVSVAVDVFGAFEGAAVYTMQENAGCFIVSQMMMGMPVATLKDDMARSAVCELANIISGNVATIFAAKEIVVDIKPPQLKFDATESDFPFTEKMKQVVCIPLTFNNGHIFEVDVMIP